MLEGIIHPSDLMGGMKSVETYDFTECLNLAQKYIYKDIPFNYISLTWRNHVISIYSDVHEAMDTDEASTFPNFSNINCALQGTVWPYSLSITQFSQNVRLFITSSLLSLISEQTNLYIYA